MGNRFVTVVAAYFFVLCCCLLTLNVSAQKCTTKPGNQNGNCISIKECQYFMNILQKIFNQPSGNGDSGRREVRDNFCHRRGQDIFICCPELTNSNESKLPNTANSADLENQKPSLPSKPNCGICGCHTHSLSRVNTTAKLGEFPWLALLEYTADDNQKTHLCTGALINDRYVLTAAHCVEGEALGYRRLTGVRLGEWNKATNPDCTSMSSDANCAPRYQEIPIEKIIAHPTHSHTEQHNDIALLRLQYLAVLNEFVKPICLPVGADAVSNPTDEVMEVAGWELPDSKLYKVPVKIMSFENCQRTYSPYRMHLQTTQTCAAIASDTKTDSCQGTSGGPLMGLVDNFYYLFGVWSYGATNCGIEDWPDVYTKVTPFIDWIYNVVIA